MNDEVKENPKLSKKLLNKTLSAKKKAAKSMRNVLSTTHEGTSWRCVEGEDKTRILQELDKIINTTTEKNIGKESKKSKNPKLSLNKKMLRSSIAFGINEAIKHLKKSKCSGLLIDAGAPKIIIAHLLVLAATKNIPLFFMKDLTDVLNLKFGFKSCAVCFKENNCEDMIKLIDKLEREVCLKNENKQIESMEIVAETNICENDSVKKKPFSYLYRKDASERVFKPPLSRKISDVDVENKNSSDFLAFSSDDTKEKKVVNKRKSNEIFKPLVIKRMKANENRKKK